MNSWPRSREVEKVKPGDEMTGRPNAPQVYVPADAKQYAVCQTRGHTAIVTVDPVNPDRCQWCGLRWKTVTVIKEFNPPMKGKG